jgi:hypothetical protein
VDKSGSEKSSIEAIIVALQDEKKKFKNVDKEEVFRGVTRQVHLFRTLANKLYSREAKRKTRSDAREIVKTISKLKQQLWRSSPELQTRMHLSHSAKLFHQLALVEAECKSVTEPERIKRDGKDEIKKWAATHAYLLMQTYSLKDPQNGSTKAPFRIIAGQLFSCAHPSRTIPDLRRACGDMLKRAHTKVGPG